MRNLDAWFETSRRIRVFHLVSVARFPAAASRLVDAFSSLGATDTVAQ